jgi:hypothetical protein
MEEPLSSSEPETRPSVGLRVVITIIAMVVLGDQTLYRASGYFGPAVFFPAAAGLLVIGIACARWSRLAVLTGVLVLALACRLAWSGTVLQILAGIWALNAFAMALHGVVPWFLESIVFLASTIPGGYECLRTVQIGWRKSVLRQVDRSEPAPFMNFALPLISVVIFGTIFVLANPDLIARFSSLMGDMMSHVQKWLSRFSPGEIVFWCVIAWITAGLLRPMAGTILDELESATDHSATTGESSGMFAPFRNTLVSLTALFSVYLIFEFQTLWFRRFPVGFHYSGYAHQGAAWLTAALALATVVLSMMFRGPMLRHPAIASLRRLAWIWSALNLLLAASVYNRMLIYVDFNGMTRMRVIGFLGITCVVIGFLLVLRKIAREYNFQWLIRNQLMVPVIAFCIYAIVPVDHLVHRYNVQRILAGHPEPSVQISEHPIDDAALPVLAPLLSSDNSVIQDGIRAILTTRFRELRSQRLKNNNPDWTERQIGVEQAFLELTRITEPFETANPDFDHNRARKQFRDYAMQWW